MPYSMARMKAHHVLLPDSFGAQTTFSPSLNSRLSPDSFPKVALTLFIIMADDLLPVAKRRKPPAGGLHYAFPFAVVGGSVVSAL